MFQKKIKVKTLWGSTFTNILKYQKYVELISYIINFDINEKIFFEEIYFYVEKFLKNIKYKNLYIPIYSIGDDFIKKSQIGLCFLIEILNTEVLIIYEIKFIDVENNREKFNSSMQYLRNKNLFKLLLLNKYW